MMTTTTRRRPELFVIQVVFDSNPINIKTLVVSREESLGGLAQRLSVLAPLNPIDSIHIADSLLTRKDFIQRTDRIDKYIHLSHDDDDFPLQTIQVKTMDFNPKPKPLLDQWIQEKARESWKLTDMFLKGWHAKDTTTTVIKRVPKDMQFYS